MGCNNSRGWGLVSACLLRLERLLASGQFLFGFCCLNRPVSIRNSVGRRILWTQSFHISRLWSRGGLHRRFSQVSPCLIARAVQVGRNFLDESALCLTIFKHFQTFFSKGRCVIFITYNIRIRAAVLYAPSSVSLSCSLGNAGPVSLSCILLDSEGWGTDVAGCDANSGRPSSLPRLGR